ncbi:MAG: peptide chain release factor-like protein [Lacunisphaera sp.]
MEASLRARFVSLGVQPDDVEESFIRGTGAGGQKINKTSSTVRLKHRSSGVEVRCQRERNQSVNRLLAWTELADRLEEREQTLAGAARSARELERRRHRQKIPRPKSPDDRIEEAPGWHQGAKRPAGNDLMKARDFVIAAAA